MALLTDRQMAAIQKTAIAGMQTEVTIVYENFNLGLELTDDAYGSSVSYASVTATAYGWLHSTPTKLADVDSGQLITVNYYRLWVPVDTVISPRDRVVIGSNTYTVIDTTADETWPAFLACSLRLAE